ncbi:MAG: hypothetical protein ACRDIC_03970 [bacterium]
MRPLYRILHAERGVALMTIMVAVFILTIVVAAMAIATMGETTLSFDQLRGQQAVGVAEAGAYRALAELRRRVTVDLDAKIRVSGITESAMQDICNGAASYERLNVITDYAYPGGTSDWVFNPGVATLNIGTAGSRIAVNDSVSGDLIGDFYAQIIVRWSGAPSTCNSGPNVPDQFTVWFDYAIFAVGRSGNATRTVCLRSPFGDRCPDWVAGGGAWQGSWTITSGAYRGWPVLVEQASYSQWALMLFNLGGVWLYTGTQIYGPVHSNTNLQIGTNPILNDVVTTVNPQMRFLNCYAPVWITIPNTSDLDVTNNTLRTSGCDNTNYTDPLLRTFQGANVTGGVAPISAPTSVNPSRVAVGLGSPSDPTDATDADVANNTTALTNGLLSIPDGLYVMDECGSALCGGIYVKGNVSQMNLALESGDQVLYVTVPSATGSPTDMKIIINPTTRAVQLRWGANWVDFVDYPANTYNGVFYINGAITSISDLVNPGGLWGILHSNMRMTIATSGEMRITDHLVYSAPPAGPGHNTVNVLGLWSRTGNITVHGEVTPNDLYIDAAVLSPAGRFWVEGWDTLPLKGYLYFLGGTVQDTFGAWGGFNPDTGYARSMIYDWRLRSNVSPPFFPQTDVYTAVRIPNPNVVFAFGDELYNRPLWEEMVGL